MSEKIINCIDPESRNLLLRFRENVKADENKIDRLCNELGIDPEAGLTLGELSTLRDIKNAKHSSKKALSPRIAAQIASVGKWS